MKTFLPSTPFNILTANHNKSNGFSLKNLILLLLLSLLNLQNGLVVVEGANILFFIGGISSHSHRYSIQPLANMLAENGHNVTFLSPLKISTKHPKIADFCPPELAQYHEGFLKMYGVAGLQVRTQQRYTNDILKIGTALFDLSHQMCEIIVTSPSFIEWLDRATFDLVIIDSVLNDCAFGIAHTLKSKIIVYGSIGSIMMWDVTMFGLPAELSWVPAYDAMYQDKMTFYDRLYNTYLIYYWSWQYLAYNLPGIERILKTNLGHRVKDMPDMKEVVQSTSLMLINQHFSDQFPRPYPPFVVPVGGMHVEESNGILPLEMENFVKDSDGFMYISFGSIVQISTIPSSLLQTFLDTMASFPKLKFLWKWEGDLPSNPPKNIFFKNWFPQKDVLAHPKIRGFIMQGGQVSIQQAIFNGVPLIVFPINGDQDFSAKRLREVGNGVELELAGLTVSEFREGIDKLLNDPSFTTSAQRLSRASRDRPMSALKTAQFWVEYVLRTDDADMDLMKPLSMRQPLWIYWCIDIWAFLFGVGLAMVGLFAILLKFLLQFLYSSAGNKDNVGRSKIKKS